MDLSAWTICLCLAVACLSATAGAEELVYRDAAIKKLVAEAPGLLDKFDAETGRFGTGIWIVQDQNAMYPLAAVYATQAGGNPHYKSEDLLEVIMKAGDALIEDADENGQWEFRKKDGSTWGMIHMPWTYSRWVRAFSLIKDDMPADRREKWEKALTLGYSGIAKGLANGHVHNIPTHHAMGLYIAGKALDRPDWREAAATFMKLAVNAQREGGYWSEGAGPVVSYNFVYTDALGTYYAASDDESVLPAIDKAAVFHFRFTYPNGHSVETIDERNPYYKRVPLGNVGFSFTPEGRAYLNRQWAAYGTDLAGISADYLASLILYGQEGAAAGVPEAQSGDLFVLIEGGRERAATFRKGPWFVCLSAYTAPIPKSRWLQDRQNLVSIYHDARGVILGGGNTKLQPGWSTFTVGDVALLKHTPGDESPDFLPKGELYHVPAEAALVKEPVVGLDLTYGNETCRVRVEPKDDATLDYHIEATAGSGLPVAAHVTLLPHLGERIETGGGKSAVLREEPVEWSSEDVAGAFTYAGCRFHVPRSTSLHWPAMGHNPYAKDGHAGASSHRIELRIPFDQEHPKHTVTVEILQ